MNPSSPKSFLKQHEGFVLKLKIKSPDGTTQIRRVLLPRIADSTGKVSFDELVGLCLTFTVPEESPDNYQVTLTYFDVDEDTITIASREELVDAIQQYSNARVLRVATEVKVKPASVRSPASAAPAPRGTDHSAPPEAQDSYVIQPQVQTVLKAFVGILSTAVNHLQDGLAAVPASASSTPVPPAAAPNADSWKSAESGHAMDAPETTPFIHYRHTCDGCRATPIIGKRFRAIDHPDYDLCEMCFSSYDGTGLTFEETEVESDRIRQPAWQAEYRMEKLQAAAAKKEPSEEEATEPEGGALFIHGRHTCDSCLTTPIVGKRFHAVNMPDYDLCENCYSNYNGRSARFVEAELERDRPFQARWHRRHQKLVKLQNRQGRLENARARPELNARGPPCRFAKAAVEPTGCRRRPVPFHESPCSHFKRAITESMSATPPLPEVPARVGGLNQTVAQSSNSTSEFDDALKEAIRRSLRDLAPEVRTPLTEVFEPCAASSTTAVDATEDVEHNAAVDEISPAETNILFEPNDIDTVADSEEAKKVEHREAGIVGRLEDSKIVVESGEFDLGGLSLEETRAMEDAMETASVDSEKLLFKEDEKMTASSVGPKGNGNGLFFNDSSFQLEAAGNGDVAEAVGATLDMVAGMISEMLAEPGATGNMSIPSETAGENPTTLDDKDESPSGSGALIVEQTVSEESEWQVVGKDGDEERALPDDEIARAAEMLGSALFNSSMGTGEQNSEGIMSNLSDSLSVPSTVSSINVADSQRARWCSQLEQLRELGFDDESKIVEILERLQAANIGVESDDDISVARVVNMIFEDK